MIIVNIEDKEFKIASKWEDVTFGQYINVLDIKNDSFSNYHKSVEMVAAISNDREVIKPMLYALDINHFNELGEHLKFLSKPFDKEVKRVNKGKTSKKFLINGKEYVIKNDYDKLTVGEMISGEILIQTNKNLHPLEIAYGVLFREVGEDGKPMEFSEEGFIHVITHLKDKVKLLDIYSYISFFLSGDKNSTTKPSQGFSIRKA